MLKWVSLSFAAAYLAAAPVVPAFAQPDAFPVTEKIHQLCEHIGLQPGEIGYTYCIVSLKASVDLAVQLRVPVAPNGVLGPGGEPGGPDAFFRSPPLEQRAREGGACLSLGFVENSSIYWQCVNSLDGMLTQLTMNGG